MERHDPRRSNHRSDFAFLPETGGDGESRGRHIGKTRCRGWVGLRWVGGNDVAAHFATKTGAGH